MKNIVCRYHLNGKNFLKMSWLESTYVYVSMTFFLLLSNPLFDYPLIYSSMQACTVYTSTTIYYSVMTISFKRQKQKVKAYLSWVSFRESIFAIRSHHDLRLWINYTITLFLKEKKTRGLVRNMAFVVIIRWYR